MRRKDRNGPWSHIFISATLMLIQSKSKQNLPHYVIQFIPLSIEDQFQEGIFNYLSGIAEMSPNNSFSGTSSRIGVTRQKKCLWFHSRRKNQQNVLFTFQCVNTLLHMYSTFHLIIRTAERSQLSKQQIAYLYQYWKYTRAHQGSLRWCY